MPATFSKLEYYGRGPEENYVDRHSSAFIGKYESDVKDEYYPYIRPQESGNHTDIRYFSIFNPTTGKGITFEGYEPMECSAIPYLVEDLDSGIEKTHGDNTVVIWWIRDSCSCISRNASILWAASTVG